MGRAIAMALGRDGFEIIVHGRDAARGAQAAEGISQGARGPIQ
jgi:NAD(P)-dependent dehydrogenase (short-subunit alcohol dehydrogenase family)